MEWIILAAVLLVICAVVFVYVCWLLFSLACAKKIPKLVSPLMDGLIGGFDLDGLDMVKEGHEFFEQQSPCEWSTVSFDGLRLCGVFLPCENARATVILFHGYRSSAMHDFSGVLPFYHSLGLNILLVDHRAHGKSEGKYITYGVFESRDALSWTEEHNRRLGADVPVILDGISMGGATVSYAAGLELPQNVRGVIDDCGYTSPKEQIQSVMKMMKIPVFPFYHVANAVCRVCAGFSFSEADARETLGRANVPFMFIHGEDDAFVSPEMGKICYESCASEKSIFLCPGATHGMSYVTETEKCQALLYEFVNKILD